MILIFHRIVNCIFCILFLLITRLCPSPRKGDTATFSHIENAATTNEISVVISLNVQVYYRGQKRVLKLGLVWASGAKRRSPNPRRAIRMSPFMRLVNDDMMLLNSLTDEVSWHVHMFKFQSFLTKMFPYCQRFVIIIISSLNQTSLHLKLAFQFLPLLLFFFIFVHPSMLKRALKRLCSSAAL